MERSNNDLALESSILNQFLSTFFNQEKKEEPNFKFIKLFDYFASNLPLKIQLRFLAALHGIKWKVYLSRCQLKFLFPMETQGMQ